MKNLVPPALKCQLLGSVHCSIQDQKDLSDLSWLGKILWQSGGPVAIESGGDRLRALKPAPSFRSEMFEG